MAVPMYLVRPSVLVKPAHSPLGFACHSGHIWWLESKTAAEDAKYSCTQVEGTESGTGTQ